MSLLPTWKLMKTVPRAEWCLQPYATCGLPLNKPVKYVVVTFETPTFRCNNREECILALRKLYKYYVEERNLADIPFNFLIAEDGTIYEARGFNSQPSRSLKYHWSQHGNRIDVAFIGDHTVDVFPAPMSKGIVDMTVTGVEEGYIHRFYEILSYRDKEKADEALFKEKQHSPLENTVVQDMAYRITKKHLNFEESQRVMKDLIPEENMPTSSMCLIM